MRKLRIGLLSLQGCVQPHQPHIEALDAVFVEVKRPQDFDQIDGLILPGGESTAMLKIIDAFSLEDSLKKTFNRVPVWGICAGAILVAKHVQSPAQRSFDLIDMTIERNSYGRQLDSFNTFVQDYSVAFIRAPQIVSVGKNVAIQAEREGQPIWVQSKSAMATTFHPELNSDAPSPMHRAFIEMINSF